MKVYKKVIVTGHLGFMASAFCENFKDVYDIAGIDFCGWGALERNLVKGVKDYRADISDAEKMHEIISKVQPDAIINFAAESHVDRSNEDDTCFWRSNVFGARNLALEASRLGIRLLQVSTDEVYGDASSSSEPWVESSPINPKNPYSVTKAAAEMILKVYSESEKYNLDVVITRGANTIGPRQSPEKAVPKAIWCFINDKSFPLFRTPAKRMWLYVDDHVAGIEAALRSGKKGEVYNIAPKSESEEITENIIERIYQIVGNGKIEKVDDRDNYDLRYWMDSSKAKQELGWEAKYNLEQTIRLTTDWYLKNLDWLEEAWQRQIVGK